MSEQDLLNLIQVNVFPEKTSKLSAEIARLMRDGEKEKARELLQAAMDERAASGTPARKR